MSEQHTVIPRLRIKALRYHSKVLAKEMEQDQQSG